MKASLACRSNRHERLKIDNPPCARVVCLPCRPHVMSDFSIGVDLGGTNLRIAAIDEEGHMIEKVTLETRTEAGRDQVVNGMCEAIRHASKKYKGGGTLLGVGIGVPGIIDMDTGMVRESANLRGWSDYSVRDEIERRLGAPVILENDANVAALGEKWLGVGRHVEDMMVVTLGTGVGGGVILGGKIWHGITGMAGEFGHMTVEPEGQPCGCGNRGCLEQYASATAIVRMARETIASGDAPGLLKSANSDVEFSAKEIYTLAMQGDEAAHRIFRRVGRALGICLSTLINGLNLEMYVIGGGVSSAWDAFAPAMFEELPQRSVVYAATAPTDPLSAAANAGASPHPGRKTIITRALLGSDAGLYGAARLPMNQDR
jgi:glucokinase